jgi:VanZ family protein
MIRRTKCKVWLCSILLALNLFFIWGNSLLPGKISLGISNLALDILRFIMGSSGGSGGSGLLRKLAHGMEFACLGVILSVYVRMFFKRTYLHLLLPLACGFAVACIDELIQIFVPGRGPGVVDVLIDTCGAVFGIAVVLLVYFFKKRSIMHSEE